MPDVISATQIIPADKWRAVFVNDEASIEGVQLDEEPLVCWALVAPEGKPEQTSVQGFSRPHPIESCEDMCNFVAYLHESEQLTSELFERGREILKELRRND